MAKEIMIPILEKLNITQWLGAGFKGQNVKVWNCEDNRGHGANSRQMIIDVAPDVQVVSNGIFLSTDRDKITSMPTVDGIDMKDYVLRENPQLISSSLLGDKQCTEWDAYIKDIVSETSIPIISLAGNSGNDGDESLNALFPAESSIYIGALGYNGSFFRESYSSSGNELDFTQSVGWWSGTSAATPFQVGMCAIIMSRYGFMSNEEMYKYLKMISKDYDEIGHDALYGWGQPTLPHLGRKYITMTVGQQYFHVNENDELMDTVPVNIEGNVFVPIRAVSESLGYAVEWNDPDILIGGKVKLTIGSNVMFVDGKKVFLNFAPYIDKHNRTLVPVRAIAEAFGCKVEWVQSEQKVMILEV